VRNRTFWEKVSSKSFRKAAKTFIIFLIIFTLVVFIVLKFSLTVKQDLENNKQNGKTLLDYDNVRIEEDKQVVVENISVT